MRTEIACAKSARDGGRYASDLREAEWRSIAPDMPASKPPDRHRLRVGGEDENVGTQLGRVEEDAGSLDAQMLPPQRMLAAQDFGETGIERGLAGARHRHAPSGGAVGFPP